jgi:hypothetical protein
MPSGSLGTAGGGALVAWSLRGSLAQNQNLGERREAQGEIAAA